MDMATNFDGTPEQEQGLVPYQQRQYSSESQSSPNSRRQGQSNVPPKIRRRNRLITSCLECRRRKLKCDKQNPCSNCTKFVRDCVFLAPALDPAAQLRLAEIKEKMGSLERTLEDDVARRAAGNGFSRSAEADYIPSADSSDGDSDIPEEDERDLEPSHMAMQDATYHEDADDDLMDLGIKVGKMRITDRMGGLFRPKLAYELAWFINKRTDLYDENNPTMSLLSRGVGPGNMPEAAVEAAVAPGADFIAPSSSFFFAPEPSRTSFLNYLPSKAVADRLFNQYWEAVHAMCKVVHRPSFERQYYSFWQDVAAGTEPPASLQALVFACLLSAAISIPDEDISIVLGVSKAELLDTFQKGTEAALYRANFLRSTKLQTLQAFIMYLIPLCRREVSRAHAAMTGLAIRLAECMGLHRDGSHYGLSPVEVHVRRLLWHQLCFLDLRTCEATGPRPQIHRDDYDTKFPLNVNDAELENGSPPTEDSIHWTDTTFIRMRFEATDMHRWIWFERARLEKKKTTLTAILAKVKSFISATEARYMPMLDKDQPLHYMAFLVYKLLTMRMYIMVLHRFASNGQRAMPDRLRRILLSSGVSQVECAITVEINPTVKPWAWYCGAYHQYHTTLLLLTELYAAPQPYHQDRIWKCLDFVFELPEQMERKIKARLILTEVMQKSFAYQNLRKVRAPKNVEERLATHQQMAQATVPGHRRENAPTSASPAARAQPLSQVQQQQHLAQRQNMPANINTLLAAGLNAGPAPEFRNYPPQMHDAYYQAPGIVSNISPGGPMMARQHARRGVGESSRGGGPAGYYSGSSGGRPSPSPGDGAVDVDWNEWDRLFPPDNALGDLAMPDFHFDSGQTYFAPPVQTGRNSRGRGN